MLFVLWPFLYCPLSFLKLRFLITPLVSSNCSYKYNNNWMTKQFTPPYGTSRAGIVHFSRFRLSCVSHFVFFLPAIFTLFGLSIAWSCAYLINVIPETCHTHLIWLIRCYYYYWSDTSTGGLLFLERIILPIISVSAPTRFIICVYCWNIQFLNNYQNYGGAGTAYPSIALELTWAHPQFLVV